MWHSLQIIFFIGNHQNKNLLTYGMVLFNNSLIQHSEIKITSQKESIKHINKQKIFTPNEQEKLQKWIYNFRLILDYPLVK